MAKQSIIFILVFIIAATCCFSCIGCQQANNNNNDNNTLVANQPNNNNLPPQQTHPDTAQAYGTPPVTGQLPTPDTIFNSEDLLKKIVAEKAGAANQSGKNTAQNNNNSSFKANAAKPMPPAPGAPNIQPELIAVRPQNNLPPSTSPNKPSTPTNIPPQQPVSPPNALSMFFDEADALFGKYVGNGRVAYSALKKDQTDLNRLLGIIANADLSKADSKTKQAFYINAYNILVIKNVLDHNIPASPLDVKDFFSAANFKVAQKTTSLDNLEKNMLFGLQRDARFHFVLVCAAIGCPQLVNFAYNPNKLEAQLTQQTRRAINDNSFIQVNTKAKTVAISKIFEWYASDFGTNALQYINQYRNNPIPADYKLSFYEYNWKLNKQ